MVNNEPQPVYGEYNTTKNPLSKKGTTGSSPLAQTKNTNNAVGPSANKESSALAGNAVIY